MKAAAIAAADPTARLRAINIKIEARCRCLIGIDILKRRRGEGRPGAGRVGIKPGAHSKAEQLSSEQRTAQVMRARKNSAKDTPSRGFKRMLKLAAEISMPLELISRAVRADACRQNALNPRRRSKTPASKKAPRRHTSARL